MHSALLSQAPLRYICQLSKKNCSNEMSIPLRVDVQTNPRIDENRDEEKNHEIGEITTRQDDETLLFGHYFKILRSSKGVL